jgi:DNA-directed RNA polymerase subunit RPC12/RpoP
MTDPQRSETMSEVCAKCGKKVPQQTAVPTCVDCTIEGQAIVLGTDRATACVGTESVPQWPNGSGTGSRQLTRP